MCTDDSPRPEAVKQQPLVIDRDLLSGLIRAFQSTCEDRYNRWAVHDCTICFTSYKDSVCTMGVCPDCFDRILKLREQIEATNP